MPKGTLMSLLREAGFTREELNRLSRSEVTQELLTLAGFALDEP